MNSYEKVREDVMPGMANMLKKYPLDYAGDWTDFDRRMLKLWNAAMGYAASKAGIRMKENGDGHDRGFNEACNKIASDIRALVV